MTVFLHTRIESSRLPNFFWMYSIHFSSFSPPRTPSGVVRLGEVSRASHAHLRHLYPSHTEPLSGLFLSFSVCIDQVIRLTGCLYVLLQNESIQTTTLPLYSCTLYCLPLPSIHFSSFLRSSDCFVRPYHYSFATPFAHLSRCPPPRPPARPSRHQRSSTQTPAIRHRSWSTTPRHPLTRYTLYLPQRYSTYHTAVPLYTPPSHQLSHARIARQFAR